MNIETLKNSLHWKKEKLSILERINNSKYNVLQAIQDLKDDIKENEEFLKKWNEVNSEEHIKIRKLLSSDFPDEITSELSLDQLKELKDVQSRNISDIEKDVLYMLIVNY